MRGRLQGSVRKIVISLAMKKGMDAMLSVQLAPLYYAEADGPFLFGLTPMEHQKITLDAIEKAMQENRTLAIINASVTGSGKTLANYAYSILHKPTPTIGVYPTNELIRDQERSLIERGVNGIIRIDSVELDIWQQRIEARSHAQVLHAITGNWVSDFPIVLTNPDILYLLMYNLYGYHRSHLNYREQVLHSIASDYPILVFDEFHLYNVKQEANAAFITATIARLAPEKPHIFIFSSATPELGRLEQYLQRANIEPCYVHTSPVNNGALVCEPVTVELLPADLTRWKGSEVLENEFGRILAFLERYPTSRGVFIFDGVYEAKLLAQRLTQRFGDEQIGELHGYMDQDARRGALERRFTVGTTTIDVGVDFTGKQAKDFIVFEARTAEQFAQRLGRIGRQRRKQQEIPNYAIALVPEYVCNALSEKYLTLFNTQECTRDDFFAAIRDCYTAPNLFKGYLTKYAPLESAAAAQRILKHYATDVQADYGERLKNAVTDLFLRKDGTSFLFDSLSRWQWYTWKRFGESKTQSWDINGKIIKREILYFPELEQFRGSSDLTCAIYDRLDENRGFFPFKVYRLPFVARRTEFRELAKEQFLEHLERFRSILPEKVAHFEKELRKNDVLDYVIVTDLIGGKAQQLSFELELDEVYNDLEQLRRFTGLRMNLQAPPPCSVEMANEAMEGISDTKNGWLCWVCEENPFNLQRIYKLPPLFELFPLNVTGAGGGMINDKEQPWSLAIGLSAIFMDSLPPRRHKKDRAIYC
jgi:CRISPR-associated endonuclease/helicase Cas3